MSTQHLTTTTDPLIERHRAMWALGDYPRVAREVVAPLGSVLVDALDVRAGEHVLDVAAGTGNAAVHAARRGARVVASDLTPELVEAGRAEHPDEPITWDEANAEALPYDTDAFDVVMSCIGAMFAPHHEATARELVRVCKPGGTIAMLNWTPEGLIGDVFRTMGPYMPAPPPGATPPPRWGSEEHVQELFGDAVTDLHMERDVLPVDIFDDPVEYRDYFKERYGPTIVAYRNIADDPERTRELDDAFAELSRRANRAPEGQPAHFEQEYLLLVGRRA